MPEPDAAARKDRRRTLSDQYAAIPSYSYLSYHTYKADCFISLIQRERWHRALRIRLDERGLEIWEVNPLKGKDFNSLHIGDRV
jgi:hypothetical protein